MIDDPNDAGLQAFAAEVIEEILASWTIEDRVRRPLDADKVADAMLARADKHGPFAIDDYHAARRVARAAAALVIARDYHPTQV